MDSLQELIADMDSRFTSGNSVPVRTVQLTAAKWAEVRAALEAAQSLQSAPEGEWVLVPRALCVEVEDQLIDLSNCKAGQRDYRPREREFDSDILRRFREAAAPSPSAALQAGEV